MTIWRSARAARKQGDADVLNGYGKAIKSDDEALKGNGEAQKDDKDMFKCDGVRLRLRFHR